MTLRSADAEARTRRPRTSRQESVPTSASRTGGPRAADARDPSLDVSLWVRLLESNNHMLASIRKGLKDECTLARFDLLANLAREDGQTLAALSRRMLVTAGNLTGLVARAERDGVVRREADPNDRRLSRVRLTKRGRTLIDELLPRHGELVRGLLSSLEAGERRELRRLLGKLRSGLLSKGDK